MHRNSTILANSFGSNNPSNIIIKCNDEVPLFRLCCNLPNYTWHVSSLANINYKQPTDKIKVEINKFIKSNIDAYNGNATISDYVHNKSTYSHLIDYVIYSDVLQLININNNKFICGLGTLILIGTENKPNIWVPLILTTIHKDYLKYVKFKLLFESEINPKVLNVYLDKKLLSGSDALLKNIRIAMKKYLDRILIYNCHSVDLSEMVEKATIPKFKKPSDKSKYFSDLLEDVILEQKSQIELV